jgi:flavorubredoxin
MEQPHVQQQQNYLDAVNHLEPDRTSVLTLWRSLHPDLQNQLTQCLAELIHRIHKPVAAIEKEGPNEQ